MLLTVTIIMVPVFCERLYQIDAHPTLADKVRLQQKKIGKIKKRDGDRIIRRGSSVRTSNRSVGRSGYAFDHQEGFGELITSGSIMRRNHPFGTVPRGLASSLSTLAVVMPGPTAIPSTECQTSGHSLVESTTTTQPTTQSSAAVTHELVLDAASVSSTSAKTENAAIEMQETVIRNGSSDDATNVSCFVIRL